MHSSMHFLRVMIAVSASSAAVTTFALRVDGGGETEYDTTLHIGTSDGFAARYPQFVQDLTVDVDRSLWSIPPNEEPTVPEGLPSESYTIQNVNIEAIKTAYDRDPNLFCAYALGQTSNLYEPISPNVWTLHDDAIDAHVKDFKKWWDANGEEHELTEENGSVAAVAWVVMDSIVPVVSLARIFRLPNENGGLTLQIRILPIDAPLVAKSFVINTIWQFDPSEDSEHEVVFTPQAYWFNLKDRKKPMAIWGASGQLNSGLIAGALATKTFMQHPQGFARFVTGAIRKQRRQKHLQEPVGTDEYRKSLAVALELSVNEVEELSAASWTDEYCNSLAFARLGVDIALSMNEMEELAAASSVSWSSSSPARRRRRLGFRIFLPIRRCKMFAITLRCGKKRFRRRLGAIHYK